MSDLAAVRARLENNLRHEMPYGSTQVLCGDIRAFLAAYAAQAARLAALDAAVQAWAHGPHRGQPPHCAECCRLYDVAAGAAGEGRDGA
jgi:hypothetical protein